MVTHDLDSLHTVCDRIAVLADGRVITAGPIPTLLASEHPWVKAYFRGKRSRVDAGGPVHAAERQKPEFGQDHVPKSAVVGRA
jgi:ABC-type transporter Mla maintaining outer membrane lipid asymmetry ATPase subunit MlaF